MQLKINWDVLMKIVKRIMKKARNIMINIIIIDKYYELIFQLNIFTGIGIEKESTEDHGNEDDDCLGGIGEDDDIKKL